MYSKGFKVVAKERFEIFIDEVEAKENEAIVKVETGAICKADLRYYLGLRDDKILDLRYPLSLIHEATGIVIKDNSGKFNKGDKVVLCPNIAQNIDIAYEKIRLDSELGENYIPTAQFASSNIDGFSRNIISFNTANLIKINNEYDNSIVVFAELISVACAAIRRISLNGSEKVGIWGDGILGYILSTVLSFTHNGEIIVIGSHAEKLKEFMVNKTYHYNDPQLNSEVFDAAFECIGGVKAEVGINQIIDLINIGSKIVLTGVSENGALINTRKILEKGIGMFGSTRSSISDFQVASELLDDISFRNRLKKLVIEELSILSINDYYEAFEKECRNKKLGKYILNFDY